jgi:nicotinamidase-related amidase
LAEALLQWELSQRARVGYVAKGNNPWTENFSVLQAEVPDPADPGTHVNMGVVSALENADVIYLVGEARSHCLANTGYDIAAAFKDPMFVRKLVLVTDCTNDVPGYEFLGERFVRDMTARGMRTATSAEILSGWR